MLKFANNILDIVLSSWGDKLEKICGVFNSVFIDSFLFFVL